MQPAYNDVILSKRYKKYNREQTLGRAIPISAAILLLLFAATVNAGQSITFATQEFYPFSYQENNRISGPGADIVRLACTRLGTEYAISIQPWRRSMLMLRKGGAQSIFLIGKTPEREKWMYFSPAVIETEYGFFECTESPLNYKGPSSLTGKFIGVYGPSNTSIQLEKLAEKAGGKVNIDITIDDTTQFRRLSRCRVDAVYSNRYVGLARIRELKIKNVKYSGTGKKIKYYIAFSKEYTPEKFVRRFNTEIKKMLESGEIQKILDRYEMRPAR